jgi:hypothetical protein
MKFVNQLIGQHLQRYPRMQLADIYKLLHQAAMGAEHAIDDPAAALRRLEAEAAQLGAGPADPVVDPISPDGQLARIHLRPYLAAGHDLGALAEAFVRSARVRPPDPDKLAKYCACLGDLAQAGGIPFSRTQVEAYVGDIVARTYPVVRHSETYREAYAPAYRVVAVSCLPSLAA